MALCDQLEQEQESSLETHDTLVTTLLGALTDASGNGSAFAKAWQRIQANFDTLFTTESSIDQLKQTILQLAVTGKLVPQDPEDEPASMFLDRIKTASKEYVASKRKSNEDDLNPRFHQHILSSLPESWQTSPIEDLFKFIDYRGRTPERTESGVRLITAKNVRMGFLSDHPIEYIASDVYPKWMTRGLPMTGDILFVTEGHTMGFAGILDFRFKYALAQRTIDLQPFFKGYSKFYLYFILSEIFQTAVTDNATGSAAKGIKASKLKRIRVVVPPLAEQHRIVTKVDELMALCEQLKANLATAQATQLNLADSFVKETNR